MIERRLTVLMALSLVLVMAPVGQVQGGSNTPAGNVITTSGPVVRLHSSWAPPIARGLATRLAAYAAVAQLTIAIPLKPRDPQGLAALARAVSDPASPLYRHYLPYAALVQRFGPAPDTTAAVVNWLQEHGITATATTGTAISFRAPVSALNTLFGTEIDTWRAPSGRTFFGPRSAPAVPQALAPLIDGVVGLDNAAGRHPQLHRVTLPARTAGQAQRATALHDGSTHLGATTVNDSPVAPNGGYTPAQIRGAYDLTSAQLGGLDGSGQTIDLFELDGYDQGNINTFDTYYNVTTGTPTPSLCQLVSGVMQCTGGSAMTPGGGIGQLEVESDIEVLQSIAPAAMIRVYEEPSGVNISDADYVNFWQYIISAHDASIISTSWGGCEQDQTLSVTLGLDALFQLAAASGIGIYAASGDNGSYDCNPDGTIYANSLAVDNPASDPYVIGVGGTDLTLDGVNSGYGAESAWNDGGGGVSTVFTTTPSYQSSLSLGLSRRLVPDVSAHAGAPGYSIYTEGAWRAIVGTSLATPLWAATMALADQSALANGGSVLGFANPTLYALAESSQYNNLFHDVTSGNNDYLFPGGSTYNAGTGYDLTSGWGSMRGSALIAALAAVSQIGTSSTTATAAATPTATAIPTATATSTPQATATGTTTPQATVTATSTPNAGQTATAVAAQTGTAAAAQTGTAEAAELATVLARGSAVPSAVPTIVAQLTAAPETQTAAAQQTSAAATQQSATVLAQQTQTALAAATQTAGAQQTGAAATQQASTVSAQQTQTAAAQATQTTIAQQTSTAAAQQTATALAQQTQTAAAQATQTTAAQQTSTAATTAAQQTATAAAQASATAVAQQTVLARQTATAITQVSATAAAQTASTCVQQTSTAQQSATATSKTHTAPAQVSAAATATCTALAATSTSASTPTRPAPPTPDRHTLLGPRPPTLPILVLHLPHSEAAGGGFLPFAITTTPHGKVTITLKVTKTVITTTGRGKHRKTVRKTLVLFSVVQRLTANARGQITGKLHITYRPVRAVHATLSVASVLGRRVSSRTATVTLNPPAPQRLTQHSRARPAATPAGKPRH